MMHNIISHTYKSTQMYKIFVDSYFKIKENINVRKNIEILHLCLFEEQKNYISYECLEYFVNNNVLQSLSQITEIYPIYKPFVLKFIEKCILLLPADVLGEPAIVKTLKMLFKKRCPLILPIATSLTTKILENENIMVLYVADESLLVDFLLEFYFSIKEQGDYALTGLLNMFLAKSNIMATYFVKRKCIYLFLENFNIYFDKTLSNGNEMYYSYLEKHFVLIEILICKCKSIGFNDSIESLLEFNFDQNATLRLESLAKIIVNTNNTEIVKRLLDVIIPVIFSVCYTRNEDYNILNFLKTVLKHKKLCLPNLHDKDIVGTEHIMTHMQRLASKGYLVNFDTIKNIQSQYMTDCRREKSKIFIAHNIYRSLIEAKIYDYEVFFLLLVQNKALFVCYFTELKNMLADTQQDEKELLNLWFCFSLTNV